MNKYLLLLVTFTMLLFFTGCGADTNDGTTTDTSTDTTTEEIQTIALPQNMSLMQKDAE